MRFFISMCVPLLLLVNADVINGQTSAPFSTPNIDPCYNYTSLDEPWRAIDNSFNNNPSCDYNVNWDGWYRLFNNGQSAKMPESCVGVNMCGSNNPLWLNGSHPQIEDGVVTRQVCSPTWNDCCGQTSNGIQIKACPGNYFVYEFVSPSYCGAYCIDVEGLKSSSAPATTVMNPPTGSLSVTGMTVNIAMHHFDPCNSYTILDEPWRAISNKNTFHLKCDTHVSWSGWYRLFIRGQSVQMPDTCVDDLSCGTHAPLWLDGPHPRVEDGVVTRGVCGNWFNNCCFFRSNPVKVKACPGNFYVYELTSPSFCYGTYCADDRNITIPTATPDTSLSASVLADPCYNYTVLDEPWRAVDQYSQLMCDAYVNWSGWYRLLIHGQSAKMPDKCVSMNSCSTHAPLWLNGQHPRIEDGVVTRHVCGHWNNDCCHFQFYPMKVKACPGDYYVYEFVSPTFCYATYCAVSDPRSNMSYSSVTPKIIQTATRDPCSDLNCTENERCGERNGVYGCFCNQTLPKSNPDTFDAYEMCESSSGFMSLSRCQLFEAGFSAHLLHLNDPGCRGTVQNDRVEFRFDNNGHICGTGLVANGTHIIYENFIFGQQGSAGGVISRNKFLRLRFNCIYQQTQSVSMDIKPIESIVHRNIQGLGTYQVRMISYQDAEFSKPFTGSVSVEVDQKIFMEVRVDGVDGHQFSSVIDTCWATPVNDPQSSLRWDLIIDECPNPNDNTVELLQNGISTSSRFSFRMFIFTANSTKVYLHCKIHLCIKTNNTCSSQCSSGHHQRVGRSLDFHDTASISMGPLVLSKGSSDILAPEQVKMSRVSGLCGSLMLVLVLVLTGYTIF